MHRVRSLSGALCVVLLLLSASAYGASSPEAAVQAVQRAIDSKDDAALEACVDLDHLLKQVVGTFLDSAAASASSEKATQAVELPPAAQALVQAAKNPQMRGPLQALLTNEARSFVLYGVSSGHFAGKPDDTVEASGLLAPFLPQLTPGRKSFTAAGPARKDGKTRVMPVDMHDAGAKETTRLDIRFAERNAVWVISEIANLTTLLDALTARAAR